MAVTFMDAMGDVRSVSPAPKHLHEAVMAGARYRRIRAETRLAEVRTEIRHARARSLLDARHRWLNKILAGLSRKSDTHGVAPIP
jgi:hypothetical protein